MIVDINWQEIAMALLNGLLEQYETNITPLRSSGHDNNCFAFKLVENRQVQEEQRKDMIRNNEINARNAMALFHSSTMQKSSVTAPLKCTYSSRKSSTEDSC